MSTNGVKNGNGTQKSLSTGTKVWQSLSLWLPQRNPDYDFWWGLTGPHLAIMLENAGYAPEKQFEMLLFHYNWSVSLQNPSDSSLHNTDNCKRSGTSDRDRYRA